MTWATTIAALLSTFGPMLSEWLKKWLEDRLKASAALIPAPAAVGNARSGMHVLFDATIAATPRVAFARRALLRRLKAVAVDRADELARGSVTLAPADVEEIRDAAGAADSE